MLWTIPLRFGFCDDPSDEHDGFRHGLRLGDDRAHVEDALHGLRHEQQSVRQPPRGIPGGDQHIGFVAMIVALVGVHRMPHEGKHKH